MRAGKLRYMAEKAATPKLADEQADSLQLAHLKFREKELSDKLKRINSTSDAEFGDASLGHNRAESIRRVQSQLSEVQCEIKKAAK